MTRYGYPHRARCLRARTDREQGSVTAEFALVLPATLMVLLLAIGAILLATQRLHLTAAAAELARLEARGDHTAAAARSSELGAGVSGHRETRGSLHCVTLRSAAPAGLLALLAVEGRGCAARSDALR